MYSGTSDDLSTTDSCLYPWLLISFNRLWSHSWEGLAHACTCSIIFRSSPLEQPGRSSSLEQPGRSSSLEQPGRSSPLEQPGRSSSLEQPGRSSSHNIESVGICLKHHKYSFILPEVEYLGHSISEKGVII